MIVVDRAFPVRAKRLHKPGFLPSGLSIALNEYAAVNLRAVENWSELQKLLLL